MRKPSLLLASAMLMCGAVQLHADEVKLTTALPAGENLSLALNADLAVELIWGNGEKQTLNSTGSLHLIPVKDANLTITSTVGKITSLYIQGNKISALDLNKAENLKALFAADNDLTTLNVAKCKELETLDVQDNKLTGVSLTAQLGIKDVNAANNQLEGRSSLRFHGSTELEYLVVSNNQLFAIPSSRIMNTAKTVWVNGNNLNTLNLSQSSGLRSLQASDNGLKSLTLDGSPVLADVWVDNNSLEKIDLSKGSPALRSLSADNNHLHTILWDSKCQKTCKTVYVQNNSLFINSMPTPKIGGKDIDFLYQPQADYVMEKVYDLDKPYDWADFVSRNGWDMATRATCEFVDRDGKTLERNVDFTEVSKKFTFKTPHVGVVLHVKNNYYEFQTTPFNIGTTEAVGNVVADKAFSVSVAQGQLKVAVSKATSVAIYNASGVCLVQANVAAGTHTWTVAPGIYVVNGEKVLVP